MVKGNTSPRRPSDRSFGTLLAVLLGVTLGLGLGSFIIAVLGYLSE